MKSLTRTLATLGLGASLALTGCGPEPNMEMETIAREIEASPDQKYSVVRIGVFEDDLAYNGKRGVYEVYDSKGKLRFFGISGIGVSELGSHLEIDANGEDIDIDNEEDER